MIPLYELLRLKFPMLDFSLTNNEIIVSCDDDREWISKWLCESPPQPTEQDIQSYRDDPELQAKYQFLLNTQTNALILAKLDALDLKSIRALRAGDQTYIQQYEQEAQQLRAQLLPTS